MTISKLLEGGRCATAVSCYDALSARLIEEAGHDAVSISGYDVGASRGMTETLLTETELATVCRDIRRMIAIPMVVDLGAGFGDPMHVAHAVDNFRRIGVDAVHIEDQVYPKRAHYFRDYHEHVVPLDEMLGKLEHAVATAGAMAVVGRTDTYKTHGEDEAIRRCRAFGEVGVAAVLAFPNSLDEAVRLPGEVGIPVIYVNTHGNRVGRPALTSAQAHEFGYAMLMHAHVPLFAAVRAIDKALATLRRENAQGVDPADITTRQRTEDVLRIADLWRIEAATVEAGEEVR
jgi:2-methylisocitrate lyase-like PEP mutase family enzyme